ncbi:hypothetical protein RIF29_14790 [Crotalaria pallida]|uniref:Dilute domain-containing protein n=1 Tax=Crotalaria pallida TaxID=3830 RepID=A0AAN9IAM1_CROPI
MQCYVFHQGFRSSNSLSSNAMDVVHQVDAKYPALLFKQQLAAYVEKIYGIIRENLKKDLLPLLSSFTQAHKTSQDNNQPDGPWLNIIECLNRFLKILKENYVHPILVQKIFSQTFQYINVEIFNSLLLHQECCTLNNGEHVKAGLAELELWCSEATETYVGSSLDELKHATQAVRFLVVRQKDGLSYDDLTNDLCPVTTSLKFLMTDDEEDDNKSFLLEDNSSIDEGITKSRKKGCMEMEDENNNEKGEGEKATTPKQNHTTTSSVFSFSRFLSSFHRFTNLLSLTLPFPLSLSNPIPSLSLTLTPFRLSLSNPILNANPSLSVLASLHSLTPPDGVASPPRNPARVRSLVAVTSNFSKIFLGFF